MRYTESQLSSALLDQQSFEGVPIKYAICTPPRSGSYMLCRYLVNAGIGVPHEYFNPMHIAKLGRRFGVPKPAGDDFASYVAALLRNRTCNGVFGAKIQFWQYKQFLRGEVGSELLRDARFIFLIRADMLAQAVSYRFSRLTGKWGFDDEVTTEPWAGDFFDMEALKRDVEFMVGEEMGWRNVFVRRGIVPLIIVYEDFVRAPKEYLLRIAEFLQLEKDKLDFSYSERDQPATGRSSGPSKKELAQAFLEFQSKTGL